MRFTVRQAEGVLEVADSESQNDIVWASPGVKVIHKQNPNGPLMVTPHHWHFDASVIAESFRVCEQKNLEDAIAKVASVNVGDKP